MLRAVASGSPDATSEPRITDSPTTPTTMITR